MSMFDLYSIRMRASGKGAHVSGAERLVSGPMLAETAAELVRRALNKQGPAEQVTVTIDAVAEDAVRRIKALDVLAVPDGHLSSARAMAKGLLIRAGVGLAAVEAAFRALDGGPSPSEGNMRGAMVMDAGTGERLEDDQQRGIRASRFDWDAAASADAERELRALGLTHHRTREALALASKVAHAPGILAELCWSDDPDYVAGYVAGPGLGYVRFPEMKPYGVPKGGRAFFVDRATWHLAPFRHFLETTPVLITSCGAVGVAETTDGAEH